MFLWVGGNMNPPSRLLGQSEEDAVILEEQEAEEYFQHKNSKKSLFAIHYEPKALLTWEPQQKKTFTYLQSCFEKGPFQ